MFLIFLLLTGCCLISVTQAGGKNDTSSDPCGVTGSWVNELGSGMELTCQADSTSVISGSLSGRYNSAVGHAKDFYKISGRYARSGTKLENCIVGFTVAYNNDVHGNSNSTASFTGNYFSFDDTIYTHWILVYHTQPGNMWLNSNMGKNIFKRQH
ncbi:Hypothetical predicted protein [Mytilus galloprovincialis]|uniref:Uncharacterized protein n=1 Tax=Mytilus galloprovincialis TaxID=29158 RepID=A0A8B6G8J9_MYTGA|nr:Hypothetical predicted protein [Mytilus galloprovincialis]